jgi:hypothetical protein
LRGENAGMDEQVLQLAEQLRATGFLKLSERERRVITGIAKRTQISRDVNRTFAEKQTLGDRLADRVASFGGSWTFIAMCLVAIIELHEKLDRILGEHLEELLRTQREQLQLLIQLAPANSNAQ